jgi:hypothetical protein
MATIYNSQLKEEIRDGAKIQQNVDNIPSRLADSVVPTMEVNPKFFRRINVIARATSTGTIYTTPTDKDFFFVGCQMAGAHSTASASGSSTLSVIPEGQAAIIVSSIFARTSVILDVDTSNSTLMLPLPIKLAKGSIIAYTATNFTANACTIFGYEVYNNLA